MKKSLACMGAAAFAVAAGADIVRISEPDAYVQDGLVAAYDGIRNAGLTADHDPNAAEWACLVPGGPNLEFKTGNGKPPAGEEGFWTPGGYVFMRATLAEMKANVTLGQNFTMQLVCELDLRAVSEDGDQYEGAVKGTDIKGEGYPTLIGETRDHGLYIDRYNATASGTLLWKGDDIVNSFQSQRAACGVLYPRTLTALADDAQYGVFGGAARANMNARTVTGAYANTRFSLGGRINSTMHYSKGLYRGARFYNRALSDEELAHNHRIDMVRHFRYHPRGTVTIARSQTGATGAEGVGTWDVTGAHTFTSPERVTLPNGVVYRCTGYELSFSEDGASLGEAEVHAGELAYTYDNADGDAPGARLAWTWELESGLVPIDAAGYVADGLLLHFDGIENAGARRHDGDAATWFDHAGGCHAACVRTPAAGEDGNWTDTGYAFHFGNFFQARARTSTSIQSTLQVACDAPTKKMLGNRASHVDTVVEWPTFVGADRDMYNFFYYAYPNGNWARLRFKTGGSSSNLDFGGDGTIYNCFHNGHLGGPTAIGVSKNADYPTSWRGADGQTDDKPLERWAMGEVGRYLCVGGVPRGGSEEWHRRNLRGVVHAVRYYARLLTPSELAHNQRLDDIRFRGGDGAGLVVASDRRAVCGDEANGPYDFAGRRVFTAPAEASVGGRTYVCVGYRLEGWDAVNGYWTNPREGAGTRVELDSADGRQRLTWRWKITRALRTVADFDVDDYVQNGLVAAYDGIRNAGAASRPAARADGWADWSGNGKDATIHQLDLGQAWTNHVEGAWLDTAYRFNGQEVMRMDRAIGLGRTPTIQGVVDFVAAEQLPTMSWPTVVAAPNDAGVFTVKDQGNANLYWKTDPLYGNENGNRSIAFRWGGRYFTLQCSGSAFYTFEGATRANGRNFACTNDVPVSTWAIGAGHSGSTQRAMVGNYHALRFYNRFLSEEELKRNRAVDEARFRGVLAETNLVVAISRAQIAPEAVEPRPGVYQVEGAWTLKAGPAQTIEGGKEIAWRPVGCDVQELGADGAWRLVESRAGDAYSYEPGAGVRRVVWRYVSSRGTLIVFR
ncbi:MAG: hypothetical protein ACI4RA_10475 [Kiritimatiellia bacterium]